MKWNRITMESPYSYLTEMKIYIYIYFTDEAAEMFHYMDLFNITLFASSGNNGEEVHGLS